MIGYKLVTQEYRTREGCYNETKWEIGVKVEAKPGPMELCTDTVVHFYDDPLLAVLMNPTHAEIANPRMLEVEIHGEVVTSGTKCGAKSLTPIREIEVPEITKTQRRAFGLLCAEEARKSAGRLSLDRCRTRAFQRWLINGFQEKTEHNLFVPPFSPILFPPSMPSMLSRPRPKSIYPSSRNKQWRYLEESQ